MYIKFLLGQLWLLLKILFSAVFVFHFYLRPKRHKIWKMKDLLHKKWYFWYADTYETDFGSDEKNYLNSTYGLYELVQIWSDEQQKMVADYDRFKTFNKLHKYWLQFRWMVFRNGVWNWIVNNTPPKPIIGNDGNYVGQKTYVNRGGHSEKTWRNKNIHGIQWITYPIEGKRYFRFSFTIPIFFFNVYWNVMLGQGGSNNRKLTKFRIFIFNKK